MCFHEKILHGGATSLLMDNLFGYVAIHSVKRLVATAFINVNYRKPLYCHRLYAAEVYITKT
jgi:acyl-coenzyme A thioesterase PaaI-like protein